MKVVILAGGIGSRMGELATDIPKPMVPIAGRPIIEYQIDLARRYGLTEFLILTGHKAEFLETYFGDGRSWDVNIEYRREDYPLGTAGAVKKLEGELDDSFLVFYGDVVMDVNLTRLVDFHHENEAAVTIVVHPNDHPFDSDLVEVNEEDRVIALHNKPHNPEIPHRNLVSAALYVMSPSVLEHIEAGKSLDFARDVFPKLLGSGTEISAYNSREYIKDVGTVKRLGEVEADLLEGRPGRLNLENTVGTVFLDRDGVLNHPAEPLRSADQLRLLPRVASAVRQINRSDRLAVVITNQPLIAKGFATEDDIEQVHAKMEGLLSEGGAWLDGIYYCPHHPEGGHDGERTELKIQCVCRKPQTGMIERAKIDLGIDLLDSFIVGDRTVDIQAGINAGLGTILVKTGSAGRDGLFPCDADFVFDALANAVDFLSDGYSSVMVQAQRIISEADLENGGVVAIGGLSRSGKTTLAGAIALALRKKGTVSKRMFLDDWLLGFYERSPDMTVRERYQYANIQDDLKRIARGETIEFDRYDPNTRDCAGGRQSLSVADSEVLIIDGVVSLDIPGVRALSSVRVYTEVDEYVRNERVRRSYRQKGLTEIEIDLILENRKLDEDSLVLATREFADLEMYMGDWG